MKKFILSLMGLAIAASAFAITPADPTDVSWFDYGNEDGYSRLSFTLPQLSVDDNVLNTENMGYRVYIDNDQIFTFERSVYTYDNIYGDVTDIYSWQYEGGTDFTTDYILFYRTNADGYEPFFTWRIGIQVFYVNDDNTRSYSNIVYDEVFPQTTLPKPATPMLEEFIDYGNTSVGINVHYDIPHNWGTDPMLPVADDYTIDKEFDVDNPDYGNYTLLDPEKVSFSLFTDNGKIFTFTPELFPNQVTEPVTQFPYNARTPNGDIGYSDMHIRLTNKVEDGEEPFFTWRIGIQTYYTDGGQTSASDLLYMEVYPQLKEAAEVTSTSFLADWSCDAEDTYILAGFKSYELYVIDKATQETVLVQNVEPTNPIDDNGTFINLAIPGATYTVEGLTPGNTYEFYVVCSDYDNSFNSVVREVTLPNSEGDHIMPGDVNHDGKVDVSDVTALIALVLGNETDACTICANVNGDDKIDVSDVTAAIAMVLEAN